MLDEPHRTCHFLNIKWWRMQAANRDRVYRGYRLHTTAAKQAKHKHRWKKKLNPLRSQFPNQA
jgi:hypothetical protein